MIRRGLDRLYLACGGVAALFLGLLLLLVVVQIVTRWLSISVPGLTTIAGYLMGAMSFFALGYALSTGSHIRVSLIIGESGAMARLVERIAVGISSIIAVYFAVFAIKTTFVSFQLGEISQGQDAILVWVPQSTMCIGTLVLAIALIDRFVRMLPYSSSKSSSESPGVE